MWEAREPVALGETPKRKFTVKKSTAPAPEEEIIEHQPLRQTSRRIVAFKADCDEPLPEAITAGVPERTLSRPVVSKADWEAALHEALFKGRMQLQRPKATPEMWSVALLEAISKGSIPPVIASPRYDPTVRHPVFFTESLVSTALEVHPAAIGYLKDREARVQRPKTTPGMWAAALEEAISKNAMSTAVASLEYDPAVLHPVFFTQSMVSNTSEIHPAANGHVKINSAVQYDPAVVHPVFFTSSLVTSVTDIHPAAMGHITKPPPKALWTASRSHIAALEAPIGPMWRKGKVAAAQFEHDKTPTIRKPVVSRSSALPMLKSTNTWQASRPAPVVEYNWMAAPAKMSRSQTWTVPGMIAKEEGKDMWTPKATIKVLSPDMFSHIKSEHMKKTALIPASLSRLTSNKMFERAEKVDDQTHWLHFTSSSSSSTSTPAPSSPITVVAPKAPLRSQTWSAKSPPQVSSKDGTSMWSSHRSQVAASPAMFSNPHAAPWVRRKRSDSGVEVEQEELESKQLWSRTCVMPESPKEWLIKAEKRVSKVQFRY